MTLRYRTHGKIEFGLVENATGQAQSLEEILDSVVTDGLGTTDGTAAVGTAAGIVDLGRFGLVADDATDDTDAINSALDYVRTQIALAPGDTTAEQHGRMVFKLKSPYGKRALITQLDLTGFLYPGIEIDFSGLALRCVGSGSIALNVVWAFGLTLRGLKLYGDKGSIPAIGLLLSRQASDEPCSHVRVVDSHVAGYWSTSALYANSCEEIKHDHCEYRNQQEGRAVVVTATNQLSVTAAYGTAATGTQSMLNNNFYNCDIRSMNGVVPPILIGGGPRGVRFLECYAYAERAPAMTEIGNATAGTARVIHDIHCEGKGLQNNVWFNDSTTNRHGIVEVRDHGPQCIAGLVGFTECPGVQLRIDAGINYGVNAASGSFAFSAQPTADTAITINGTAFTFKSSGATGNQINIGASLSATLDAAVVVLNASAVTAVAKATYSKGGDSASLQVVYTATDGSGTSFTLAADAGTNATASGANLAVGNRAAWNIWAKASRTPAMFGSNVVDNTPSYSSVPQNIVLDGLGTSNGFSGNISCRDPGQIKLTDTNHRVNARVHTNVTEIKIEPASQLLTLASGAITYGGRNINVAGEGGVADDFTSLNMGSYPPGTRGVIQNNNNGYAIPAKNGSGTGATGANNLRTPGGADVSLQNGQGVQFLWDGTRVVILG